ncbi:MAG: universal stress protein [Microthrixaceae bacterium]|nr:universal stress protein [Microthrixaceae bacterium]
MQVVIATDGSEAALEAARSALRLLAGEAELALVHVVPLEEDPMAMAGGFEGPLFTAAEVKQIHEQQVAHGEEIINKTEEALGTPAAHLVVSAADVGEAICQTAVERNADVIVMGESEKGWFRRLLEGSAMQHVVRHAPCPVIVVPHHPA